MTGLGLGCVVGVVCLLFAEAVLRLALDEVNFLLPVLVPHPVLPLAVEPGSGGHDALGFRNPAIPERVEVLAVGDSQTYGLSATRSDSWPAQLEQLSGRSVYNLSLGSYGPQDYAYLLNTYGKRFAPRTVVIGLYLGNDLMRAYEEVAGVPSSTYSDTVDPRPFGSLRTWLAQRSMLYQVVKFSLPALIEPLRRRMTSLDTADDVVALEFDGFRTALRPEVRRMTLDRSSPAVRSGIARTREIWSEITANCRALGAECFTLLIPTKILVYAPFAAESLTGEPRERVLDVAEAETASRDEFRIFLEDQKNTPIDPLPALRAAVTRGEVPYPTNYDGHPNRAGYRAIAETVATALAR